MKNLFEAGRAHRIWFYAVLALAVIASLMMVPVKWDGLREIQMMPLPPLPEMMRNAALALSGHENGYSRAAQGYGIFLLMAGAFLSSGKFILSLILRGPGESILDRLTGRERFAFYFMTGSLAYSLLWFGLGLTGILGRSSSYAVVLIGWIPALIGLPGIRARLASFKSRLDDLTTAEAVFIAFFGAVLLLISSNAAHYPVGPDTLTSHGGLPNYYIQQGRITGNHHHIYSYFTQNTEMLIMGSLLMGSDFAAKMIIWSFLAAWMILIWGFLERHTGKLAAMVTTAMIFAIPVITRSAFEFKNDSTTSLFMFVHYVCLIEALRAPDNAPKGASGKWFLLSGVAAGGMIGHKLLGVPVAFSSLLLLAVDAAARRRKNLPPAKFLVPFLIGLSVAAPWFVRTYVHTRNPIYPFFNDFFGSHMGKDDRWLNMNEGTFPPSGAEKGLWINARMMRIYFEDLLLGYNVSHANIADSVAHTNSQRPTWGASVIFVLLIVPCLLLRSAQGFRLCWCAALLSYMLLLYRSPPIRYHMGPLVFLIASLFAVSWREIRESGETKIREGIVLAGTALIVLVSNVWIPSQTSFPFLLSGYAPGNRMRDFKAANAYWMAHVVNTRSNEGESVFFVSMMETYPFHRRIFATGPLNMQWLIRLARKSPNAESLKESLRGLGVDHIVFSKSFYQRSDFPPVKRDQIIGQIEELLNRHMKVRYALPDQSMIWYSFADVREGGEIRFDARDAEQFPPQFIAQAKFCWDSGNRGEARRLLEIARDVPMLPGHKEQVLRMLGNFNE